jgi:hypothetical protein
MTASGPTADERSLGRFTEWYRQTPTALEFWEVLVTDRRLIWCCVGESFKSLLLRADMGARNRETIAELSPDELAVYDKRNIIVPLSALLSIRLKTYGFMRRTQMTIAWNDDSHESITLYNTSEGDPQTDFVETLAADERLAHTKITVD